MLYNHSITKFVFIWISNNRKMIVIKNEICAQIVLIQFKNTKIIYVDT